MIANILPADPHPLALGFGSFGQKLTFSEHGHVAYHIKGNHEMQHYGNNFFCPLTPHDPSGWGRKVKIELFQNMVVLHIKLKKITNAATW